MKLPFSFPFGKKEKPEYFLALLLREEKANAVIFEELLGKIRIVGEHEKYFTNSLESATTDELLEVLDEAISTAESSLPENAVTHKTIFGVNENWVEDSKIKKDYLVKLKKISESLELSPIGFLVIHEAIAHLMQKEEGAPVSAILIEVAHKSLGVSLLRAGRLLETKRTKLEDSIPKTTDRILHHFTNYEVLPSRIVIFDGEKVEQLSQDFIGHTWSKSLPFLHVPQITALSKSFDAKAVLFGAATQMGFELLREFQDEQELEIKQKPISKKAKMEEKEQENKIIKEEMEELEEDFGFLREKDISLSMHDKLDTKENSEDEEDKVIEEEIVAKRDDRQKNKTSSKIMPLSVFSQSVKILLSLAKKIFAGFSKINLGKILPFISVKKIPFIFGKGKIIFIPPLIVALFIIVVILYIFKLKSTITLTFNPKTIEQNQDILFSADTPTDFSKNIIKTDTIEVDEEGQISIPTTGKKEVGDKAKGSITIYNIDPAGGQTFSKDTVVKAPNGLQFLTDNSVNISSASGDPISGIVPSTTKISITAKDIGKEYNLPSGTKFTVDQKSANTVVAKNDAALSGGNKKEINIVAKTDLDKLTEELPRNLQDKAKEDFNKKISSGNELIPDIINISLDKKDFDKNAGDQAETVTLKGSVAFQGISYSKSDLEALAKNILKSKEQDMTFLQNDFKFDLQKIQNKNEKGVEAKLDIKAFLVPKVDDKNLTEKISGKSFEDAKSVLLKLPQISSIDISLSPSLPFLPKILPRVPKNIIFSVKTNG
ncbi:MAG: baseplate J/gp47 family protein [Candidatus Levybacteria bacterium]|nr:baseplate J/gp47 family protein [Candidatus Levybacteria bacterium]